MLQANIVRIEVKEREGNAREHRAAKNARQHLRISTFGSEEISVFWLKANSGVAIPLEQAHEWAKKVFCDPILQSYALAMEDFRPLGGLSMFPSYAIEVRYLPGVTDNIGRSATEALKLCSTFARDENVTVYSGKITVLYGELGRGEAEKISQEILANPLIQSIQVFSWQEFYQASRFENQKVPEVILQEVPIFHICSLEHDDRILEKMSKENCWALTAAELKLIRNYYTDPSIQERRASLGLPSEPTNVEMEIFAQTWSEHCKHKIFSAEIDYTENEGKWSKELYPSLGAFTVKSLFKSYIRATTERVQKERNLDWLISVFSDNAGIVRFDDKIDLCIKVETHNSPSALDPYGGALTGIVGVNRDVLGCGMGARPIANTDVFCFAPPDWPAVGDERELPSGLKHPRRIFEGVHLGIEDGGNKSGIPTVNGAFAFHRDFAGKPLVFCGTVGVLPQKLKSGLDTASKGQKAGHRIVMAGGRIGKDGIHGATFSSMELTEGAPATVVQIGDPITQKRLADFLLEARDLELFSSLTDNGAGGLSSSVGEMAQGTNGAVIDVALAPVKYPGLSPFELVVSESQERMTFAVPQEKLSEFLALAKRRGVEACDLGEFTQDGFFKVLYKGKAVADLSLQFLHEGLPPMVLKAKWDGPKEEEPWGKAIERNDVLAKKLNARHFLEEALYTLMARWNIRSKEEWVRRYDHEVQAATIVKPFVGIESKGPSDAAVLWLAPHGGDTAGAISIACGLQPKLSHLDAYLMAQHSLDEAVRNNVAVGGDPDMLALIDNFCWPDPLVSEKNHDAHHKLAQLVRANHGLYDLACIYGAPFVSGKDSMKNDFLGKSRFGKELKISVPPTVLVTAMAKVPNVEHTTTSDFKNTGDKIFLLGHSFRSMGGSELAECYRLPGELMNLSPPLVFGEKNIKLYRKIHQAIGKNLLRSCHDCSEGGVLVALSESAIGGNLGVNLKLENLEQELKEFAGSLAEFFFNESAGRFIVSVAPENIEKFQKIFKEESYLNLGEVSSTDIIRITRHGLVILDTPVKELKKAWKGSNT